MRRFEESHALARVLIVRVLTAATLHLLSGLLDGLSITGWTAAFGAAAWIGAGPDEIRPLRPAGAGVGGGRA